MSDSATRHVDQTIPTEWHAVEHGENTYIVRDVPEGTAELFVVSAETRNVRALAQADAVLFEGRVVTPYYDDWHRQVKFQHDYAGDIGRCSVEEWLDDPAIRLKRLPTSDTEVFEQ